MKWTFIAKRDCNSQSVADSLSVDHEVGGYDGLVSVASTVSDCSTRADGPTETPKYQAMLRMIIEADPELLAARMRARRVVASILIMWALDASNSRFCYTHVDNLQWYMW